MLHNHRAMGCRIPSGIPGTLKTRAAVLERANEHGGSNLAHQAFAVILRTDESGLMPPFGPRIGLSMMSVNIGLGLPRAPLLWRRVHDDVFDSGGPERWGRDPVANGRSPRVSVESVDEYLRDIEEPKRSTLQALRRTIVEIIPNSEQVISYRIPAFRVDGETVAGFAAFRNHLSYLPFSGSVLPKLVDELRGFTMTKSALHFPVGSPLQRSLVMRLIQVRLDEVAERRHLRDR